MPNKKPKNKIVIEPDGGVYVSIYRETLSTGEDRTVEYGLGDIDIDVVIEDRRKEI